MMIMKEIQIFFFYSAFFLCLLSSSTIYTLRKDNIYISLGKESSLITQFIKEISLLEDRIDSPVILLKKYIEEGGLIISYEDIVQVFSYIKLFLQEQPESAKLRSLMTKHNYIFEQILNGNFFVIMPDIENNIDMTVTRTTFSGDVTGTETATVVSFVGGQTAVNVAAATVLANTATNTNVTNKLVKRDSSGNFRARTITASLNGNATTATTATNFSGTLSGDVTGGQDGTMVSFVGGQTAANVAA